MTVPPLPQNARFAGSPVFRRTGLGVILQGKCVALAGPPNRVVGAPAMASALHQQLVSVLRRRHLSRRIEKADRLWIMAFLRFHRGNEGWRHLRSMWAAEVEAFLAHLAVEREVAAATQDQALDAIVLLCNQVLEIVPGPFARCGPGPRDGFRRCSAVARPLWSSTRIRRRSTALPNSCTAGDCVSARPARCV